MAASSRRPRKSGNGIALRSLVATGEMVARNPAIAGGSMAFLVSLCFVSANALWYQPHFYDGAFFATRKAVQQSAVTAGTQPQPRIVQPTARPVPPPDRNETTGALPPQATRPSPETGSQTSRVQAALTELGLYKGTVDGLSGPQTRDAIANYQRIVGIESTGTVDDRLLQHLGLAPAHAATDAPSPAPRPEVRVAAAVVNAGPDASQAQTRKIQAGLRAFGNDGIQIDGMAGADTKAALREFQSLFGLKVTGEPDAGVLTKMKAIGLVN